MPPAVTGAQAKVVAATVQRSAATSKPPSVRTRTSRNDRRAAHRAGNRSAGRCGRAVVGEIVEDAV